MRGGREACVQQNHVVLCRRQGAPCLVSDVKFREIGSVSEWERIRVVVGFVG